MPLTKHKRAGSSRFIPFKLRQSDGSYKLESEIANNNKETSSLSRKASADVSGEAATATAND